MAAPGSFLAVIFTVICVVKINVHAFKVSNPINASVESTGTIPNSSETTVEELDYNFPPNTSWFTDGRFFDYPCSLKTRIPFCCNPGIVRLEGSCMEGRDPFEIFSRNKTFLKNDDRENNCHTYTDDPCAFEWMSSSEVQNFSLLRNGSIYTPDFEGGPISDNEQYCIFLVPNTTVFAAKVCRTWVTKGYWEILCLVSAILVMLSIFIGYTIVPELKNFHGLIFRCYVATYIGTYVCALGVDFTAESRSHATLFSLCLHLIRYSGASCALWLNVMSFNIWRSFRELRPIDHNAKKRERKKLIFYGIYAWVGSAVLNAIPNVVRRNVPFFFNDLNAYAGIVWSCIGFVIVIFLCNAILYTSTTLTIRRQKKETANLCDGINKHHDVNKQWFNLHVKLFFIMGGHIAVWAIWFMWYALESNTVLAMLELLQSILLFFIFLWKDNVKRSICEQFHSMLRRLSDCFRKTGSPRTTES